MTGLTDTLADGAVAGDSLLIALGTSVSDSGTASDSVTFSLKPGMGVSDSAKASDSVSFGSRHTSLNISDSAKATDKVMAGRSLNVSDSATASDATTFTRTVRIQDAAKASDSVSFAINYHLNVSDSAKARDAWTLTRTLLAQDTGYASDSVSVTIMRNMAVSDSAQATDSVDRVRRINLQISDVGHARDTITLYMHYGLVIQDHAWAMDELVFPGTLTSFVINTRTNAVTQYGNFTFNSAFSINRKYVIANDEGLFELNGNTDEGNVNVIANIEGGYFNANGNKFAGLKGVYLKVKGQGGNSTPKWLLTLKTGDENEYVYQAPSNPGLMTSKFRMGKGLHASEIAWGIRNADGQDFDWDNIEFVPMMSGRRVG